MKRALFALGAIALGLIIVTGCNRDAAAANVQIVDSTVRDWTDPDDGKTYLVVAPTWTNSGAEPLRDVLLMAVLKGPKGQYPIEEDANASTPSLHYRGDPIDPGTTMRPSDAEDTFMVIGEKEAVLAATGPDPKAETFVMYASTELGEEPTPSQKDKP